MTRAAAVGIGMVVGVAFVTAVVWTTLVLAGDRGTAASGVDASPAAITSVVRRAAIASFKKDGLDECTDVTIAGRASEMGDATTLDLPEGSSIIEQSCAEAFADRPVLATCAAARTNDAGTTSTMSSHYYNALTLDDDIYMRDCLELQGKWTAVSRDSIEYRRSRLRGHVQQLQKISDHLNQR